MRLYLYGLFLVLSMMQLSSVAYAQSAEKEITIEWKHIPGNAIDMDISMEGVVWVVSKDGAVKKWNGTGWTDYPGEALRISAGPRGNTWIVDKQNRIYRWGGDKWVRMPGQATDIAVSAIGSIWMIGTDKRPGGYGIYKWGDTDWVNEPGAAIRIDLGPKGNPWIINDKNEIYRFTRMVWKKAPRQASDISVAPNGVPWIIDPGKKSEGGGQVRGWNGRNWILHTGELIGIAADPRSRPWGFDNQNQIYAHPLSVVLKPKK